MKVFISILNYKLGTVISNKTVKPTMVYPTLNAQGMQNIVFLSKEINFL